MSSSNETVCQEADRLTGKDRIEAYGHPKVNFDDIAKMWTVILRPILKDGASVSLTQVGLCNVATKICRHIARPKRDNLVDMAGYANTIAAVEQQDEEKYVEEYVQDQWKCNICGMYNPCRYLTCDNCCPQDDEAGEIDVVPENPSDIDTSPESIERAKTALQNRIIKLQTRAINTVEATTKKSTASENVLPNFVSALHDLGAIIEKALK